MTAQAAGFAFLAALSPTALLAAGAILAIDGAIGLIWAPDVGICLTLCG